MKGWLKGLHWHTARSSSSSRSVGPHHLCKLTTLDQFPPNSASDCLCWTFWVKSEESLIGSATSRDLPTVMRYDWWGLISSRVRDSDCTEWGQRWSSQSITVHAVTMHCWKCPRSTACYYAQCVPT